MSSFLFGPSKLRTWLEVNRNWKPKEAALGQYYYGLILEQMLAVVPISLLLLAVMSIFFGRTPAAPQELLMGMTAAILGLGIFIDALRVCVMPLSEQLGTDLPKTLSLPFVLVVAFFLGVLVTYAEPAISTLRPLAKIVDPFAAPYLYCILMQTQETLILCIGLGVGCAATFGTLRFVKGWSLKPLIICSLLPCILCSCYMWWGNPDLRPILGLAWDCGAVTTGPVTVPVLLALGIGVMKTKNEQDDKQVNVHLPLAHKLFQAQHKLIRGPRMQQKTTQMVIGGITQTVKAGAKEKGPGNELEGFGIVTLASLFPVLFVQLLAISLTFFYSKEDIIANIVPEKTELSILDKTPFKEMYYSSRAIFPLIFCLLFIVIVVIRKPIPCITFHLKPEDVHPRSDSKTKEGTEMSSDFDQAFSGEKIHDRKSDDDHRVSIENPVINPNLQEGMGEVLLNRDSDDKRSTPRPTHGPNGNPLNAEGVELPTTQNYIQLVMGIAEALFGMILFSIGLTYGFTSIGNQVGTLLPASFMKTEQEDGSPYYGLYSSSGIAICLGTMFTLGFMATRAEPALNVMGQTVEKLSKGSFTCNMLVYAVCLGVGTGMLAGSTKILFQVPLINFLLIKYAIALVLTKFSSEDFTNIAWDSAGVTTGPVTVPFVLSTGVGCSLAVGAAEGFGILACASVWPIITVMGVDLVRKVVANSRG